MLKSLNFTNFVGLRLFRFWNVTEQHYQSDFMRKHRSLTTNFAGFVEFRPHLHLIFINYFTPPDFHVTYILRNKLHMSCRNNGETFFYEFKSTVAVYDTCRKLKKVNDVIDWWRHQSLVIEICSPLWLKLKCNTSRSADVSWVALWSAFCCRTSFMFHLNKELNQTCCDLLILQRPAA